MKSYFFLKFWAKIFKWELVWLKDFEGEIYLTPICKAKSPFDISDGRQLVGRCYVHWNMRIGNVILFSDGTCGGEAKFIKLWKPYETERLPQSLKTRYQILKGHNTGILYKYWQFKVNNSKKFFGRILNWILP